MASLAVPGISEYDAHYAWIIHFLQTLETPKDQCARHEKLFCMEATKYHIVQGELFRWGTRGRPSQRVICQENYKKAFLAAVHDSITSEARVSYQVEKLLPC